ncbi:MAG: peptidylprolyl isomerase [Actinomycetes bacterium]
MPELPAVDGSSERQTSFDGEFPMALEHGASYQAEIVTNLGTMVAFLYPERAPRTVNNFVCLARYHYFDGLTFHRVIRDFVIQGGCPLGTGTGNPGYRFADELPEPGKYEVGSLAMANAGPDTNGSQFFVISGGHGMQLPPNYSLFGKLIDGFDVLEAIQTVRTGAQDRPVEPVVIESVTITQS